MLAFRAFNEGKLNLCCQFGFQRCISVFPHDQRSKGESSAVYTDPCCKDWLTTDRQIRFWSPDSRPQGKQHWRESLNRLELSTQVGSIASHCCRKREGGGRWEEQCTEMYLYPKDINCRARRQARDPALFPPPHALSPQMQLPPLDRIKGELFSLLLSHQGGESLPGKGLSVFQLDKAMTNPTQSRHALFPPSLFFFVLIFTWPVLILIDSKKQRFSELFYMKSLGRRCPCGSQDAEILPHGSEIPNMPWLNPFLLFKYGEMPKQNFSTLAPLSFISQQIHDMQKNSWNGSSQISYALEILDTVLKLIWFQFSLAFKIPRGLGMG